MTELPEPGEIILVKYRMNSGGPAYYRAVVSLAAQGKLVVRLLEAGEKILVDIADCKYANAAVLKVTTDKYKLILTDSVVLEELVRTQPNFQLWDWWTQSGLNDWWASNPINWFHYRNGSCLL